MLPHQQLSVPLDGSWTSRTARGPWFSSARESILSPRLQPSMRRRWQADPTQGPEIDPNVQHRQLPDFGAIRLHPLA